VTSVVIAAHNEEAVIGRCLDALLAQQVDEPLDITVVANGCTDKTAATAAQRAHGRDGVRVLDLAEPGKANALNRGDAVAVGFPRLYLDADIVLSPGAVQALTDALRGPNAPLAVVPRRELVTEGRPVLVRGFYAINKRLPAYDHALFGRGAITLSAAGRARFTEFPTLTADDLFLDSLFAEGERREVPSVTSRVATPTRTGDLVKRLVRVRAGNQGLRREQAPGTVRASVRSSWLKDVVLPRPWLAPAAACYVALIALAELKARRTRGQAVPWGRDDSSRQPVTETNQR
jgi:glycosyltransferase involved in cell wall biosynthesis